MLGLAQARSSALLSNGFCNRAFLGSDWALRELSELGGVGNAVPPRVYYILALSTGKETEIESEGARPTHPRARAVALHTCSAGPARLRPSSHLTPAPWLLRPSLAHLAPPAPAHAHDPPCSPIRWAQALVSGSTGSYLQGSCRSSR